MMKLTKMNPSWVATRTTIKIVTSWPHVHYESRFTGFSLSDSFAKKLADLEKITANPSAAISVRRSLTVTPDPSSGS
jgi:hypothetical protein